MANSACWGLSPFLSFNVSLPPLDLCQQQQQQKVFFFCPRFAPKTSLFWKNQTTHVLAMFLMRIFILRPNLTPNRCCFCDSTTVVTTDLCRSTLILTRCHWAQWWYASSVYNDENNQNNNTIWGATEGCKWVNNPSYNGWDEIIIEFHKVCNVQ